MPLHPYFAEKASHIADLRYEDLAQPEAMQRFLEYYSDVDPWSPPDDVSIEDLAVSGPDHDVPVRTYRPESVRTPPLVWMHGGGFSNGNLDMPEAHIVAAELAHRAGALVVSVDYRLASEYVHYPAPVDDVMTVLRWLDDEHAGPPAVGGASAGAAIALSAAIRARDEGAITVRALLLAYPFLHFPTPALDQASSEAMRTLPPLMRFTPESVATMVRIYVGRLGNLPPAAMPGAADLAGLASTAVLISEYDDLRPSADLILRQLAEAQVPTEHRLSVGVPHGHLNRVPSIDEVSLSLDFLADRLALEQP
jgi:acetyl esterase